MRFRKPTVEPLEINLTPMIDCLLFLIVFLLLATSFNHFSRLNIILPEAEGVALTEQKNSLEVAVQEDGSYLVNGITLASSNEAELTSMLQQEAGRQWCGGEGGEVVHSRFASSALPVIIPMSPRCRDIVPPMTTPPGNCRESRMRRGGFFSP